MNNTELEEIYPIAVPFKRYHELEGHIKEYNLLFRTDDSRMEDLIDFVTLPFVERVNIEFTTKISTQIIKTVDKIKDCLYVRVRPDQWTFVKTLQAEGIRFFFDVSMPATSYCELDKFIEMGVSDIYIADDLTYNLKDVHSYCLGHDVQTRIIINRIPLTTLDKGTSVKSPMYRPQDTDVLRQYYDVFEFDCDESWDWHKFNVLFKTYFIKKDWHGNLAEINPDIQLEGGYPNDAIIPGYTEYKMNCERACSKRMSNHCRKCQQFFEIGKILVEKGVGFKREKNR